MSIRVATCVPKQKWMQAEKLAWLDRALSSTECEIFLLPQEYFGGGSMHEICRLKSIETDDIPVTLGWLQDNVGSLGAKYHKVIGIGATTTWADGCNTEAYHYFDSLGAPLGHHNKIALPVQDSVLTSGASHVLPEFNFTAAAASVEIPELELRVGTVFCWQVFFDLLWSAIKADGANLVVHPIKFAPRAWYRKGQNPRGENTRTGFTQNTGSDKPEDDALGWIRKLKYESEFKDLPIAVTCNSWSGGEKFLAMCGFVDEVTGHTDLQNVPSTAEAECITVHEYDPTLYAELDHLSTGVYAKFKPVWQELMAGTMKRKAVRIEQRTILERGVNKEQPSIGFAPEA